MTADLMLSAATLANLKATTLSFTATDTAFTGTTLSVTASTLHLSASTALSAHYSNIALSSSTSFSALSSNIMLSGSTSINLHGNTALSMKVTNLVLSASGDMNYYVGSSLSFQYATGATYNFFPLATATATSQSYTETVSGGPYAGIVVTRSGTTLYELETHTFTISGTMFNNGYCVASWNTRAYDSSYYYDWQVAASCSATQMIGYLHWHTGTSTNQVRYNAISGSIYTIFLVQ